MSRSVRIALAPLALLAVVPAGRMPNFRTDGDLPVGYPEDDLADA